MERAISTGQVSEAEHPADYSIDDRPAAEVTPIVFVGGTGRSGTHVVARLLARHGKLRMIPVECRFHVEQAGFPGLLEGTVSKQRFLKRLRGFWWRGFQTNRMRGLYRFIPRERFDAAIARKQGGVPL